MDDFDLLEATIDPTDVKSLKRVEMLKAELEAEKMLIKSKIVWKAAFSPENPMRIYD